MDIDFNSSSYSGDQYYQPFWELRPLISGLESGSFVPGKSSLERSPGFSSRFFPLSLSSEAAEVLLQAAPIYCQLTGRSPITSWADPSEETLTLRRQYLDYLGSSSQNELAALQRVPLFAPVVLEGSMLNVLRILAVETNSSSSCCTLVELVLLRCRRRRHPQFRQLRLPSGSHIPLLEMEPDYAVRDALLVSLAVRKAPPGGWKSPLTAILSELIRNPFLIEPLIISGFNFLRIGQQDASGNVTLLDQLVSVGVTLGRHQVILRVLSTLSDDQLLQLLSNESTTLVRQLQFLSRCIRVDSDAYSKPAHRHFQVDFLTRFAAPEALPHLRLGYGGNCEVARQLAWFLITRLSSDQLRLTDRIDYQIRAMLVLLRWCRLT